jgi:hypothetical protein
MFDHFFALETPLLAQRLAYESYPPGMIVSPWLVSTILRAPPTPALINAVNLAEHLLLALTLAAIVLVHGARFRWPTPVVAALATVAALVVIFSRGALQYFTIYHVADITVLPYLAIYLLCEAMLDDDQVAHRHRIVAIQQVAAFMSAYTDWLFYFFFAAVLCKRLLLRQLPLRPVRTAFVQIAVFAAGGAAALALHAYSLTALHLWARLWGRFLARTNLSGEQAGPLTRLNEAFWHAALSWNFNEISIAILRWTYIIAAGTICAVFALAVARRSFAWLRPETSRLLGFLAVIVAACVIQTYTLSDHSFNHLWSGLKFVLVLSLISFSLGPMAVTEVLRDAGAPKPIISTGAVLGVAAALICASLYARAAATTVTANFGKPRHDLQLLGETIGRHVLATDLIVSPSFGIGPKTPAFPFIRRMVHHTPDAADALFIVRCVPATRDDKDNRYRILVVARDPLPTQWEDALAGVPRVSRDNGLTFIRLSPADLAGRLPPGAAMAHAQRNC